MANTEPIGLYALSYYLQRIRSFLESEKKKLSFPRISPELQKVLERIVSENTEFIHDDSRFDNNAKLEAAKVTAAIEALENVKLMHEYQDGKHGQNVLIYKKIEVKSLKPLEPTTKFSKPLKDESIDLTRDSLVTTSFKLRCLNTTVKFVKDDSQLVMKYPEMVSCQAEFVMNMLLQGKEGKLEQAEVGFGYRSMYAPLWESMKLFSLKYDYGIEYATSINPNMKRVIFEKIPKNKERPKKGTDESNKLNTSISSHSSATSTTSSKTKIGKKPQTIKKKTLILFQKMEGFIRGGFINMEFMSYALQRINEFMFREKQASTIFMQVDHNHQYFLEHVEVLAKNEMSYMLFDSECQRYLSSIKNGLSKNIFYEIRLGKNNSKKNTLKDVIFEKVVRYPNKETAVKETRGNEENISNNIQTNSLQINSTKLSETDEKRLLKLKTIKDDITKTNGENYILNRLKEIAQFLSKNSSEANIVFKRTNQEQALFLKYIHIFSKFDESYPLFSEECQNLLRSIKINAKKYEMQFHQEIVGTDNARLMNVTIKKKLIGVKANETKVSNVPSGPHLSLKELYLKCRQKLDGQDYNFKGSKQKEMKRSSSLNSIRRTPRLAEEATAAHKKRGSSGQRALSCKEKLKEGLSQPVQSDKAVKMMQSMGWTGGALGLRGDGITEPIMPAIDHTKRAGLGHVPTPKKVVSKKSKTKAGKQQEPLDNQTASFDVLPVKALAPDKLPPGILPTGAKRDSSSKIVYLTNNFHVLVLRSTLELVTTGLEKIYFILHSQKRGQKACNFILEVVKVLNGRSRMTLSDRQHIELMDETMAYFVQNKPLRLVTDQKKGTIILRKKGHIPFLKVPETKTEMTTSRQWYPKTFELCENVEGTDLKHHEKLLAAILKPLEPKTTNQHKPEAERTNLSAPIEIETITSKPIEVEATIQPEPIEVGTTIQSKSITMETVIQEETTDHHIQSLSLSAGCSSKSDFQVSNEATATDNPTSVTKLHQIPRWIDIMGADNSEDSEESIVDIDNPPKLEDLIKKYIGSPTESKSQNAMKITRSKFIQKPQEETVKNIKTKRRRTRTKKVLRDSWEMYLLSDTEEISAKALRKEKKKMNRELKKLKKAENKRQQMEKKQLRTLTYYRRIPYNIQDSFVISRNEIKTTIEEQQKEIPTTTAIQQEAQTTIAKQQEMPITIAKKQELPITIPKQDIPTTIAKQQEIMTSKSKQQEIPTTMPKQQDILTTMPKQQDIPTTMPKQQEIPTTMPKQQDMLTTVLSTETVDITEIHNSQPIQGYLILGKLPINNNDTTANKNVLTTTVSSTKENNIANDPAITPFQNNTSTAQKESDTVNSKNFKDDTTNNDTSKNDNNLFNAKDLKEGDEINKINNQLLTIDLSCDDSTDIVSNGDIRVVIDNDTHKIEQSTKNDVKTDCSADETKMTLKSETTLTDIASDINNLKDSIDCSHTEDSTIKLNTNTRIDKDTLLKDENDDCQIILNNMGGMIDVNSNDEEKILCDNVSESSDTDSVETRKLLDVEDVINETKNDKNVPENVTVKIEKDEFDAIQSRKRTSLDSPNVNKKRHKSVSDFKKLCILPQNYPQTKINNEKAAEIQTSILNAIDNKNHLPLLSCQGIQNGGLIYHCQDEKSLIFMEDLINTMEDLTIVYNYDVKEKLFYKMAFKINSFVEEPVNRILSRLELYNCGLNSTEWEFIKMERFGDFSVIYIEIDDSSFDYVRNEDFVLYAGNDCARFTIVWD